MSLQEHGYLPQYLVRSIRANPEHESVVFQFLEASQRLARVAEENVDVNFYFFQGNTENSSLLQPRDLLEDSFLTVEPDKVQDAPSLTANPLNVQREPLNEEPPSDGLIDWSEWLIPGEFEYNWTDEIPPVHESPAISLSTPAESIECSTRENNKVMMLANREPNAEDVSGEGDNIIPQAGLDQLACDEDLPALQPSYPIPAKMDRPSKQSYRSRKGESMKVKNTKSGRSSTQVIPSHKRVLKSKGSDVQKTVPETTIPHQGDESHSVMRYSNYARMWSLFGPSSKSALQEAHLMEIFKLTTLILQPDLASFLEIQSDLWKTGRFWNPDPLSLPVAENAPTGRSCYRIFHYLQDLKEETRVNMVRRRFAQVQFYLTFVRLQKEMEQRDRNSRKISSHVIDELVGLGDHDGEHADDSSKEKAREFFIKCNARGRKWFLVSHYVGWGSLIVWNTINSKVPNMTLPKLRALITYIVNAQPVTVSLCREYETPVKDLLNGKKPTLVLTQEDVERTINQLSKEVNENGCVQSSWHPVDMEIQIDESDLVH